MSVSICRWMAALLCVGMLSATACVTPDGGVDSPPVVTAKAQPLELERPLTAHFDSAESPRHRYVVKVVEPGLLTLNISWGDQNGLDRVLLQKPDGSVETLAARRIQEITHKARIDPGYHYIEVVPGGPPISYNLVVAVTR